QLSPDQLQFVRTEHRLVCSLCEELAYLALDFPPVRGRRQKHAEDADHSTRQDRPRNDWLFHNDCHHSHSCKKENRIEALENQPRPPDSRGMVAMVEVERDQVLDRVLVANPHAVSSPQSPNAKSVAAGFPAPL